jgi:hypothetical protein
MRKRKSKRKGEGSLALRMCKSGDHEELGYQALLLSDLILSVGPLTEALDQK